MQRVGITLVGHDPLVQEGIRRILSGSRFEVVATYDFLEQIGSEGGSSPKEASIILINGGSVEIEEVTLAELRRRVRHARLLVLADKFDLSDLMQAVRAGLSGYLVSDLSAARLVESLEIVAAGEKVLPPQLLDVLGENIPRQDAETSSISLKGANLTDREMQLLACLVSGMPNKLIARRLNISEATVKVHVKAVLRKLELQNRTQAAMWGAGQGVRNILDDPGLSAQAATTVGEKAILDIAAKTTAGSSRQKGKD